MKTLFITGGNDGIGYYMVEQWLKNGNFAAVKMNVGLYGVRPELFSFSKKEYFKPDPQDSHYIMVSSKCWF